MFSISNLSIQFNGVDLFTSISFMIGEKDRIGLVGKNGVGKSTLLKVMAKDLEPSGGRIVLPEGKTIGYLAQEIKFSSDRTVMDELLTVFKEAHQLEEDIEAINKELEERIDYESDAYMRLITDVTEKGERLGFLDIGKMEGKTELILKGLGFNAEDFTRPIKEFSGGWQMRVELGKLLLLSPDLLMLDEPTNHLDIESILWFESYLKTYKGAIVMISHDRMFLDNLTKRTIEIVSKKIYDYKAPYTKFLELRQERIDLQKAAFTNQQKFIDQQEKFISRFKAKASKSKQAQSKMKQLEKIERIQLDDVDTSHIQFRFPPAPRSGDTVITAERMTKAYGERTILSDLSFMVARGERIAFVGKNGMGKSTLIKLITGEENFDGELKIGHNVSLGYYSQMSEQSLNPKMSVLETIDDVATGEWRSVSRMRGLLGSFLFGEEDVDKKVSVLSGGEKARLVLAKLMLKPINLLILDEPTNHLDIASKDVLKQALLNYDGTLILVSHDRSFLTGMVDRIFEFDNGQINDKLGTIEEFLSSKEVDSFRSYESDKPAADIGSKKKINKTPKVEAPSNESKGSGKDRNERRKAIKNLERSIEKYEEEISKMEVVMNAEDFYNDKKAAGGMMWKHQEAKKKLDIKMAEWERLSEDEN
ncbi:MAG: ABC-F family ATP-binding cassette domain-containing protein [Flavobacteriales bacterium]|nr:ABC-F family ATP-binding cassette domain-containing protein [Flavobacteriales bacterium]